MANQMERVMEKRREAYREEVREMSQGGKGSIHPDFNPDAEGEKVGKRR